MVERVRTRERFKLSLAVFLILLKEERAVFLLRSDTGWMDGKYSVPGGVKEPTETLQQAIIREAQEEVGAVIQPENLLLAHMMHNFTTGQEWIGAFFITDKWEGNLDVKEPHKHGELRWLPLDDLPANTSPYVRQAIRHYLMGSQYSEYGWEIPDDENLYI